MSLLQSDATRRPSNMRRKPATSPMISLPPGPLQPLHTRQPVFFRHLRNLLLLSSHLNAVPPVQNSQLRDPLDVCLYLVGFTFDSTISPQIPATSSRIHGHTPVAHTTQGHSYSDPREHVSD
jgi:hypothetical protein